MINLDDYFSDFSPEEYMEQTDEHFKQLERENMIERLRDFLIVAADILECKNNLIIGCKKPLKSLILKRNHISMNV